MDKSLDSISNLGTYPNDNAFKIEKEVDFVIENSPKSKAKESSSPLIANTSISISDSSSKSEISKEKNDFQKTLESGNCIHNDYPRDIKEVPSVLVDEAIFDSSESEGEETKPSSPKKIEKRRKETVEDSCEKEKVSFLSEIDAFTFFAKEKFQKINLKGINSQEFASIISRQWDNMSEIKKRPYVQIAAEFKNRMQSGEEEFVSKKRNRSKNEFPEEPKEQKNDEDIVSRSKKKKLDNAPKSQDYNDIKDKKEEYDFDIPIRALCGK